MTTKHDKKSILDEITINLTVQTFLDSCFNLIGRNSELNSLVEILCCRQKNSCMIIGDPGVGKNALVEGLAQLINEDKVPDNLRNKEVLMLSMVSLLAGTKYRGEFEERMLKFLQDLKARECILFIDDYHTIVRSYVSKGTNTDIQSILKPSIERGEIQIIGTATFDDYRIIIEKDPSLEQKFQKLELKELDLPNTLKILNNIKKKFEDHHRISYSPRSIDFAAKFSRIHLRDRALPDKAIEVLDRAGSKVRVKNRENLDDHIVTEEDIADVVSEMSGIPKYKLMSLKIERLLEIEDFLKAKIIGQDPAIDTISEVIRSKKLGYDLYPHRPDGVFLFVGPTGVGKTELSRAIAEFLFGDPEKIIRLDMSEYMDNISGAKLIGTAPGYVGYHDQNQLADKIRKNPYSLVLLDEIEKANPSVLSIFLQVFDAGHLTTGKGNRVYFNNTIIVMTSNIGSELYKKVPVGYAQEHEFDKFERRNVSNSELMNEIKQYFAPEFLNRLDEIVFFNPLSKTNIYEILDLNLQFVYDKLKEEGKDIILSQRALDYISNKGYSFEYGARNLLRMIRKYLLDKLALKSMSPNWNDGKIVYIDIENDNITIRILNEEEYKQIEKIDQTKEVSDEYKEFI